MGYTIHCCLRNHVQDRTESVTVTHAHTVNKYECACTSLSRMCHRQAHITAQGIIISMHERRRGRRRPATLSTTGGEAFRILHLLCRSCYTRSSYAYTCLLARAMRSKEFTRFDTMASVAPRSSTFLPALHSPLIPAPHAAQRKQTPPSHLFIQIVCEKYSPPSVVFAASL